MKDNDNDNVTTTTTAAKLLRFAARKDIVYDSRGNMVCKAKSTTYARRIANSLNHYQPNERGQ
jgi:hypothetical protein